MKTLSGITRKGNQTPVVNPSPHSPLNLQNRIVAEVHNEEGLKQRVEHVGNILVTWGLNNLIEQLAVGTEAFSAGQGFVERCVVATGTQAIGYSADALTGSTGSVHITGASMVGSDGGARTLQYNMTIINTAQSYDIGQVGLFGSTNNAASMVAAAKLATTVGKNVSDTVNITYQIIAASA